MWKQFSADKRESAKILEQGYFLVITLSRKVQITLIF